MPTSSTTTPFRFENSFAAQLRGFYVLCDAAEVPAPELLLFNDELAGELGLDVAELDESLAVRIFSGNEVPAGAEPLAQAYAGHQFGGFVPQLGDGRALLLGEVIDLQGRRRDIALKGSGRTPFSRGGDGKAAVGPVLREYLLGEAMHALGIPTTRALAAVSTGETVRRERSLPGAVLTRVAASHVRVGTFEFFAARRQFEQVGALADYVIARHTPELVDQTDRYERLLESVAQRQASLIAQWMLVGFIHGVMNTDNMTISGETIDYGPCAFMEAYDSKTVFSSIDTGGRYAYGNQPRIACWNLARFAETLLPLFDEGSPEQAVERAMEIINAFLPRYEALWLSGIRTKLGISGAVSNDDEEDRRLAEDWLGLLQRHAVDFTLGWRSLSDPVVIDHSGVPEELRRLFPADDELGSWLQRWRKRLQKQSCPTTEIVESMQAANPIYIARNHLVEESLAAASDDGDLSKFKQLLDVLAKPYEKRSGLDRFAQPAPQEYTACYKTFCGT